MRWASKYLAFLIFMVPIPFRLETALSGPLQTIATNVSTFLLQSFTLPAIAEGNTIYIDDIHLNVVEACSGLRMCMSITAMAFAFILLYRRPIWYRIALLTALAPIAILSNATRITGNGLLLYFRPEKATEAYNHMAHDWSGYAMIPMAAFLFFMVIVYLDHLFLEVDTVKVRDPISSRRRRRSGSEGSRSKDDSDSKDNGNGKRSKRSSRTSSPLPIDKSKKSNQSIPNETELDDPQDEPQLGVASNA